MRFLFAVALTIGLLVASTKALAAHTFAGLDLRDGKNVSFVREDQSIKATVLVFLSSKCPCSHSHIKELKELAKSYPEFRFIGVNSNSDEKEEIAREYFKAQDLSFPVLRDDKLLLAEEFKAFKTPHAFVISPKGEILFQGGVTNSADCSKADKHFLQDALADVKTGKPVRLAKARALGCLIARP